MTFPVLQDLVVLEGQSLLVQPAAGSGDTIATVLPSHLNTAAKVVTPARSGVSFTGLHADQSVRLDIYAKGAANVGVVLLGGTTDVFWEADTGAKIYADMGVIATQLRAIRADVNVLACTITPSTSFFGGMDGNRQDANTLINGNANGYFDAVVDLAGAAGLSNASGPSYDDGLHLSTVGIDEACDLIAPALIALMAGLAP